MGAFDDGALGAGLPTPPSTSEFARVTVEVDASIAAELSGETPARGATTAAAVATSGRVVLRGCRFAAGAGV
jgi:hypothetical protein